MVAINFAVNIDISDSYIIEYNIKLVLFHYIRPNNVFVYLLSNTELVIVYDCTYFNSSAFISLVI